jgi:hypothetical protein
LAARAALMPLITVMGETRLVEAASAIEAFREKLSGYEVSKGTVRFPINEPIPFDLVKEIVRFRVKELGKIAEIEKAVKDFGGLDKLKDECEIAEVKKKFLESVTIKLDESESIQVEDGFDRLRRLCEKCSKWKSRNC